MVHHILNGDSLLSRFQATGLAGEIIVARECLIVGDLDGATLSEFYETRADYIQNTYHEEKDKYYNRVVHEFNKISNAPDYSEFNLWFGYDLFCQANLWFILSLLSDVQLNKEVYVVYPTYLKADDAWDDFGGATPDMLLTCFENRIPLNEADLTLGKNLWLAYKIQDIAKLENLSTQQSVAFPYLSEVISAHIERFPGNGEKGRPEKALEHIINTSDTNFTSVFVEFSKQEAIYGFGDTQVKQMYDKLMLNPN